MKFHGLAIIVLVAFVANAAADKKSGGYIYEGGDYIGEIDSDDVGDLARAVQNPVADLVSVPFQNNTISNLVLERKRRNVLNVQPVIPVDVNADWMVITRSIIQWCHSLPLAPLAIVKMDWGILHLLLFFRQKGETAGWVTGSGERGR